VALTEFVIKDKLANVRGAVMMAYPMGLPEWDTTKLALDSIEGVKVRTYEGFDFTCLYPLRLSELAVHIR